MKRSSEPKVIAVIGGGGFLGRHVVKKLAAQGHLIKVGVRHPESARHLLPMGNVGQIKIIPVNVRYPASLRPLLTECDSLINLVGILNEQGKQTFRALHEEAPKQLALMAQQEGIRHFVHVSALGAHLQAKSRYARTKAGGEKAVLTHFSQAHILRPSLIFGAEDHFFNRFATLAGVSPFLPLFGGGRTRFQPVFVEDVAEAIAQCATGKAPPGLYELAGPQVYTFAQLMKVMLQIIERRRLLVPFPLWMAYLAAIFLQWLPHPLLTVDQVRLLKQDSVAADGAQGLEVLGIHPTPLEVTLPQYLNRFRGDY